MGNKYLSIPTIRREFYTEILIDTHIFVIPRFSGQADIVTPM